MAEPLHEDSVIRALAWNPHQSQDDYYNIVANSWKQLLAADITLLYLFAEETSSFLLAGASDREGGFEWVRSIRGTDDRVLQAALRGFVEDQQPGRTVLYWPLSTPGAGAIALIVAEKSEPFAAAAIAKARRYAPTTASSLQHARMLTRLASTLAAERDQAQRMNAILQTLTLGVIALDAHGRVRESNPAAYELLGLTGTRRSRHPWEQLVSELPPRSLETFSGCILSALNGVRRRDEFTSPDGRPVCVDAIPFAGGAILVLEDLGPRLEQERELARVKRLAEIGQMTAAIAHELRNPLTSIRGAAQMITSERRLKKAREWAEVVLEEVADLERLCNEFLDFARPVEVAPEEVNLAELIEEVLAHDEPYLRQAGIRVSYRRGKRKPIIMGDPVRLSQAVRNLIRNAVEAMPEGGCLTVSVTKSPKGVRVRIADEGEGMTEEQLSHLFTPFYTTKANGTGLGLCNVKKTVEAHRGSMSVESRRGKGTTVTMIFPGGTT